MKKVSIVKIFIHHTHLTHHVRKIYFNWTITYKDSYLYDCCEEIKHSLGASFMNNCEPSECSSFLGVEVMKKDTSTNTTCHISLSIWRMLGTGTGIGYWGCRLRGDWDCWSCSLQIKKIYYYLYFISLYVGIFRTSLSSWLSCRNFR